MPISVTTREGGPRSPHDGGKHNRHEKQEHTERNAIDIRPQHRNEDENQCNQRQPCQDACHRVAQPGREPGSTHCMVLDPRPGALTHLMQHAATSGHCRFLHSCRAAHWGGVAVKDLLHWSPCAYLTSISRSRCHRHPRFSMTRIDAMARHARGFETMLHSGRHNLRQRLCHSRYS